MSTTELVLNMLAETAAKDISHAVKPDGIEQNKSVAQRGGRIAGNARRELEEELGHSVITSQNAIQLNHIVEAMIETSAKTSEQDKSSNGEENGQ